MHSQEQKKYTENLRNKQTNNKKGRERDTEREREREKEREREREGARLRQGGRENTCRGATSDTYFPASLSGKSNTMTSP